MDFKDTLDTLKDKATDLAQAGVAQSKRLAEIAKLKMSNMAEEDAIKKAYVEIGKLYYAEQGATPDGAYAAACEKITASKALIETNNERIAELKQPGDPEPEVVEAEAAEAETVEVKAEEAPAQCSCGCGCEEEKEDKQD
jgi:hypothetical protein